MTAYFPIGMESYNNTPFAHDYVTWKGVGTYAFPIAKTAGNIRPLLNGDPSNWYPQKFGLPRPVKGIFRRGTTIRPANLSPVLYPDRQVRSTTNQTMVRQLLDAPGLFNVFQNGTGYGNDNKAIEGVNITVDYQPFQNFSENPQPICMTKSNCCNQPKKALLRVRGASTILKPNYYTRLQEYRQARCQTFQQKQFNFYFPTEAGNSLAQAGSPAALANSYYGGCYPSTCLAGGEGCKTVIYKPKNYEFATQGAVESSARTFKLAVSTAETDYYQQSKQNPNGISRKSIPSDCGPCALISTQTHLRTQPRQTVLALLNQNS